MDEKEAEARPVMGTIFLVYFSMYFAYLNFSVIRTKIFFACTEGFG